jgi:hypothetical protein
MPYAKIIIANARHKLHEFNVVKFQQNINQSLQNSNESNMVKLNFFLFFHQWKGQKYV